MATINISTLFLGNIADLDTDEGTLTAENASALLTTFGSAGDPLSNYVVNMTTTSTDTQLERDNVGTSDRIEYETSPGGSTVTRTIDSIVEVGVNIRTDDGSSTNVGSSSSLIFQDDAGNLFYTFSTSVAGFLGFDTNPVERITVTSIEDSSRASFDPSRNDDFTWASTGAGPTICFLSGTLILTPRGEIPVEKLRDGDLVDTAAHGAQPVLRTVRRAMNFKPGRCKFKPYRVQAGALGNGLPKRPLRLSRQHRVLVHDGQTDVLAPACGLARLPGVSQMKGCESAVFYTLIFARHETIYAEGTAVESFYPGTEGLSLLPSEVRGQLLMRFPGLEQDVERAYGAPTHPFISRMGAVDLVANWTRVPAEAAH